MTAIDHRVWLATAVDRLERSIAAADAAAPVESCPGWDVRALTEHVVGIHDWVSAILRSGAAASAGQPSSPPGGAAELAAWYRAHADEMQGLMAEADGAAACWNFSGVSLTYAFWPRRQTHEVTVHTVDVERAAGRDLAVDADIAADGIDEVLTVFAKRMADRGFAADVTEPIVLAPTDVDVSWTVSAPASPGGAVRVSRGADARAVAAVSASASDLLLALWKRVDIERLEIAGERDIAVAYLSSRLAP